MSYDHSTHTLAPLHLGDWVSVTSETCRSGRVLHTLVNHRTRAAFEVTAEDLTTTGTLAPDLVDHLVAEGFAATAPPPPPGRRGLRKGIAHFLAELDIAWRGADRWVHRLHRTGLRHCFHPLAVAAQVLLALAGVAAVVTTLRSGSSVQLHVDAAVVPVVIGIGLVAVAVHELAHALVVVHHGRSIDSIGFRVHLGTPSFYVESVEALLLTRRQRLVQAAAGPWAEWLLTSAVALAAWGVAPRGVVAVVLTRFVVLNAVTVLSNLLPFGGLDGSHLLADLAGVPDLQRRSRTALGRVARSLARGGGVAREDLALCAYALANVAVSAALVLFSAVLWVELFGGLVRSMWHAGPLGVAGLAAAAVLFGRPLLVAGAPGVLDAARTCAGVVHDVRFRRSVQWRRAAMLELRRVEPALRALDERALGIAAGLLTLVPGAAPQAAAAGQLVVPVAPMRGARRGGAAVLDLELLRRCEP